MTGAHGINLQGRGAEIDRLDLLVRNVRAGASQALVIHGEAGVGKTALLESVTEHAVDCGLARVRGVPSETELPFAALHQLCGPMLDHLDRLPQPQRDTLATVFGLAAGSAPDPFLVGLATLSLLSEMTETRPLLCLVDDHQWLDQASQLVLAFVARRLRAESLGLIFATRVSGEELRGLPQLVLEGLDEPDARALLDLVLAGSLDERVRDRIIAETRGNPLALVELPRGRSADGLGGGYAVPRGAAVAGRVEADYRRRTAALPGRTRELLLLAAADPTGDAALVWRAARRLHIEPIAAAAAADEGLAEFDSRVRFSHPLARSICYWSAPVMERQRVHRALADETDRAVDPDRRSWHLAHAGHGPDEDVADELERSAGRARARGGMAAAGAFLQRATVLTVDPEKRARRALAAAVTRLQAGAFEAAAELLDLADAGPLSELDRARISLLRAQLAFVLNRGGDAPLLMLQAAAQFEPIEPRLARETYLDAFAAATFAGRGATSGGTVLDVARAAAAAPQPPDRVMPTDCLLAGLAANFNEGYPSAVPHLQQALATFGNALTPAEELRSMWSASSAALHLWDDEQWLLLSDRYVNLARESGALSELPLALSTRALALLFAGELGAAAALIEEQRTVTAATGSQLAPYGGMLLAAMRGASPVAETLIETTKKAALAEGEGISIAVAEWTRAVLRNGQGKYDEATEAARRALHHQEYPELHYPGVAHWAAAELIEATSRSGQLDEVRDAVEWISEMASASDTSWALGVQARSRALLASGDDADSEFGQAISLLEQTSVRSELARTHLLYGEWLRRERRRVEARDQLRTAHRMLSAIGMKSFAERARHELLATGETARRRSAPDNHELTAQELLIAELARDGLSNPEIGGRLFISARTVQYHLSKVFAKLHITSRSQLDRVQLTPASEDRDHPVQPRALQAPVENEERRWTR